MGQRLSQHQRLFYFHSPLGEDKFLVRSLEGEEAVSSLFRFTVELLSDDGFIEETALLGQPVTFAIRQADDKTLRYFNGRVSWFRYSGPDGNHFLYRAEIVPWTWLLTQAWDCNVRQDKSVPKMVEDTFRRYGFSGEDFQFVLRHDKRYNPWEFSAQYRESSYHYAARLLEAEGIFFFYRQSPKGHQMVLADDNSACEPCPYQARFRMDRVRGPGVTRIYDTIFSFDLQRHLRPAGYVHRDFNFLHPDPRYLHADAPSSANVPAARNLEVFDYPGEYEQPIDGQSWARLRMEAEEAEQQVFEGTGNARSLTPGFRFELSGHERREWNRAYLVTRVAHRGREASVEAQPGADKPHYENTFECIPASIPFRTAERAPKSQVAGLQTAIVVGPKNEEIYTDKHGRIRVKFHWDHSDKQGDDCSFWIRVAHPWAGANWGAFFLPRVGQEVVVDFLEGDPDRPIVIGSIHNADHMPPWPLPSQKNVSGIRTRSTKGGGPKNYNEISFDDTRGEELFALHAEKDLRITVENDETDIIDRDRFITVKRDHVEAIQRHHHASVDGNARRKVEGTLDERTGGQHTEQVGGSRHTTIGGDWHTSVGGHVSLQFGTGAAARSGGQLLLHTQQGLHAKDDSRVLLETGSELTLKGPGGFITINAGGIYIQGSMVYLNSGGSALSYPGSSPANIDTPAAPQRPPGAEAPAPLVSPPAPPAPALPKPAPPAAAPDLFSAVVAAARERLPALAPTQQQETELALEQAAQLDLFSTHAPLAAAAASDTGAPTGWQRASQAALANPVFVSNDKAVLAFRDEEPTPARESQAILDALAALDLYGRNLQLTGHANGAAYAAAAARLTGLLATAFHPTSDPSPALPFPPAGEPGPRSMDYVLNAIRAERRRLLDLLSRVL